jgi:hypothetical protein
LLDLRNIPLSREGTSVTHTKQETDVHWFLGRWQQTRDPELKKICFILEDKRIVPDIVGVVVGVVVVLRKVTEHFCLLRCDSVQLRNTHFGGTYRLVKI